MNLELIPGRILTIGAAFITGFILAAWCLPTKQEKPRFAHQESGVIFVIPMKAFKSPESLPSLRGKPVQLVRNRGDLSPCLIGHKPARLQTADQQVFLEVGFDGLESLVVNLHPSDLQEPDLIEASSARNIQGCSKHPRVTYGS